MSISAEINNDFITVKSEKADKNKKVYSSQKLCYDKQETGVYYAYTEVDLPDKPKCWISSQQQS